jgi:predicted metal-dependent hydrolase
MSSPAPVPEAPDVAALILLRRSRRARQARLTVRPDGVAVVTLPSRAPEAWAHELLALRAGWLERHRTRLLAERARLAARPPLGEGRGIPLGGVPHLVVVEALPAGLRRSRVLHEDVATPRLRVQLAPGEGRELPGLLEPWLRGEARVALERRVALRAPELAVTPRSVSVRDQRSRWGSASRRGALSFSWRLVMAPPVVLDYVVVHELAHLRAFGHGPAFWGLVEAVAPQARQARRWLREHDAELRHALT